MEPQQKLSPALRPLGLAFAMIMMLFYYQSAFAQTDSVDLFLQKTMKERAIPGLQVAVVRQGKIIKSGAYGVSNLEFATPVTSKTVFTFNSITKVFTGVALMQLIEQGKLDMNAPVSTYLDNLPETWRGVTIRQMVSNTSGLPDVIDPATGDWLFQKVGDDQWKSVLGKPLEFKAGEKFSYNQTGFVLLGLVLEKLTGKPFQDFIKENQLAAVGMPQSGFGDFYDVVPNMAKSYSYRNRKYSNVAEAFPAPSRTAAGMYGTAEELAQWAIALQKGQLLKEKNSVSTLWSPVPLNNGTFSGFTRLLNGYAMGWPTMNRAEHRAVGGVGGGRSAFFIYPEDDLTIVVLTNRIGCAPETFIDELAGFYVPSMKPATGFGLPPEIRVLHQAFKQKGFKGLEQTVRDQKKKNPSFTIPENDLNDWGYLLWKQGSLEKALAAFKLNTILYPNSGNTFDSYAEALMSNGEKELAIKNYKQALALSPNNAGAKRQLEILQAK
ncbi:serine hydrolase [Rufibacter immobilis]|uniref:Serine hydrolase n=1 Tax=Rufibacter immobilis TaxID=1348778 RepID=A0A3M9MQN8_9BACT|nr:serine hydrolase [Rufibacter immobilis]RNI27811.1 serine hydrolase [Rufibacter immobilis]